eukprot:15042173-Alexandrium_andersonii.AAC.1
MEKEAVRPTAGPLDGRDVLLPRGRCIAVVDLGARGGVGLEGPLVLGGVLARVLGDLGAQGDRHLGDGLPEVLGVTLALGPGSREGKGAPSAVSVTTEVNKARGAVG